MKKLIVCVMAFLCTLPIVAGNDDKVFALTFDDGPNTTTTPRVLDCLEKYNVVATFFLIGDHIDSTTESVMNRAVSLGCEIGNHSKTHSYMDKMTADQMKYEIKYTSDAIHRVTGKTPKFFRPPYIAVNDLMYKTIDLPFICGYNVTDWDPKVTPEERAQRVVEQAKDGAIVLLHDFDGNFNTVIALDSIIPKLKEQGYRFVTVSQLFKIKHVNPKAHAKILYSYVGDSK
jgi:peptidoglycan-N-acetylglucosamine deacetylase